MMNGRYGYKSDVFAVGLICFYLLSKKYSRGKYLIRSLFKTGCRIPYKLPSERSQESLSFMNNALEFDPEKRSSVDDLLSHSFIHQDTAESKSTLQVLVTQYVSPVNFNKAIDNF